MGETPHLIFTLQGTLFALEALLVQEIIWLPELTPLTTLPGYMPGVVIHRGNVVPVMDLGKHLGFPAREYHISDQIIFIEWKGIVLGLIVNEVLDACTIPTQEITPIDSSKTGEGAHMPFITHVAKQTGGDVMLLDIRALLQDHQSLLKQVEEASGHLLPSDQEDQIQASFQTDPDRYFFPGFNSADRTLLRERAINISRPTPYQDMSEHTSLAVVRLNHEYFGVDLACVQEFAEVRDIIPIPCCPQFIIGNMNLRGDVLTLLDIRTELGMGEGGIPPKVIVTRTENFLVGILVDDVTDSIHLNPRVIMAVPSTAKEKGRSEGYLKGTVPYRDGSLSLLDLPKLLMSGAFIVDEQIS